MEKQGGMAFGLGKTATAVIKPERWIIIIVIIIITIIIIIIIIIIIMVFVLPQTFCWLLSFIITSVLRK
jgi:heme/copper-type cytochrome/quinol oxidase subunit 2